MRIATPRRAIAALAAMTAALAFPVAAAHASSVAPAQSASSSPLGGTWGKAVAIAGAAGLADGNNVSVSDLSCWSPGNCSAVGSYGAQDGEVTDMFVASQVNGAWHPAVQAPGSASLGELAVTPDTVSCASAGNCAAGGWYDPGYTQGVEDPFVITESGGTWGDATAVTGLGQDAADSQVTSVSCPAAGDCTAVGVYSSSDDNDWHVFTVGEQKGTWGEAQVIPGIAAQDYLPSYPAQVSCWSAGNCVAAVAGFAAVETGGTWGTATEFPGTDGDLLLSSVSCAKDGQCTLGGGNPVDADGTTDAVTVSGSDGAWGPAADVPGSDALAAGYGAFVSTVSCTSGGNCAVGGYYGEEGNYHPFVASETDGKWGNAREITGGSLSNIDAIDQVDCASAGNCSAIGNNTNGDGGGFVVTEINGTWSRAQTVTGDYTMMTALSCSQPGLCTAAGGNGDAPWAVNEETATAATVNLAAKVSYGDEQSDRLAVTVASKNGGSPAGTASIVAGSTVLCKVTISAGQGSCALTSARLGAGTYHLAAAYSGSLEFWPATSSAKTLSVGREPTRALVALGAAVVRYGSENKERISVSVKPRYAGTVPGKVTVKAGSITVCVITLTRQKGTCALPAEKLKPGTYNVRATYAGDGDYTAATSAAIKLKVAI